uniref:Uncharacterized protein n=1 Tax=Pithovirus LCPAC304 TaxID=2506594 RepID=A0A481Z759_9VIRU|nr:MAG: hypothetical protein LCPAC304_00140 [Pithovirus LCPAC304]
MQDVDKNERKTARVYLKRPEEDGPGLCIAETSCQNLPITLSFGVSRFWQPYIRKAMKKNDQEFLCDLWAREIVIPTFNRRPSWTHLKDISPDCEWANPLVGCTFIVMLDDEVRRKYKIS